MRTVLLILAYSISLCLSGQAVRAAEPDIRRLMDSPHVAPCIEAVPKVESQAGRRDAIHKCEGLLASAGLSNEEKSVLHGILGSTYFSRAMAGLEPGANSENMASILTAEDNRDIIESTRHYTLALESWQNSPMAYYNLWNRGFNKELLGRIEEALSDYDEVVRLRPDFLKGYLYRARMLVLLGKRDQARVDLESAFRLAPYDPAVMNAMKALSEDNKQQE